ncbi:MAG: hypothetical protein EOP05_01360 [Proteobacteria bacterium]|nr:MAG: hypothetical protein EOP05_01360 [Pseudomonadota bacterium]
MRKHLRRSLISIGVIIALFLIIAASLTPSSSLLQIGLPNYAKNLPGDFKEASQEFDMRVQAEFKAPLYVSDLIKKLSHDGFVITLPARFATVTRYTPACSLTWTVRWDTNSDGTVGAVHGTYLPGCL